jgi:hypothetical protein
MCSVRRLRLNVIKLTKREIRMRKHSYAETFKVTLSGMKKNQHQQSSRLSQLKYLEDTAAKIGLTKQKQDVRMIPR